MAGAWKNKSVIVTGAAGFMGAWLCRKLVEQGALVTALVHSGPGLLEQHGIAEKVKIVKVDVRSHEEMQKTFSEAGPDLCFHLAAKSSTRAAAKDLHSTFETNVLGTVNVLAAAKETGSAVVFTSTVKTYGGFTEICFAEDSPLLGTSAYAASKIAAEAVCRMFAKQGLNVAIARPANVFGDFDDNFERLVPGAIRNLLSGKPPVMLGKGESMVDMVYVEDVIAGILLLGEKVLEKGMKAEAFNFGSGEKHSVKEAMQTMAKVAGKKIEPVSKDKEMLCKECLCVEKSEKELGWKAEHSLEDGLRKTIEFFKEQAK